MTDIPKTMKALVLKGPNDFEIQEVPTPEPKGDEVLCRVKAVAICGTDPKIVAGKFPGFWPPLCRQAAAGSPRRASPRSGYR